MGSDGWPLMPARWRRSRPYFVTHWHHGHPPNINLFRNQNKIEIRFSERDFFAEPNVIYVATKLIGKVSAFVLNCCFKKSNELVHKCPRSALRNQIQKKFQRMTNVFHSVECLNLVLSHSKHWRTFIHTKFEKQILSVLNPVALLKSCNYWRSCFLIPGFHYDPHVFTEHGVTMSP